MKENLRRSLSRNDYIRKLIFFLCVKVTQLNLIKQCVSDYLIKENSFVNISVCHLFDKKNILVTEQEQGHNSYILLIYLEKKVLLLAIPV